MITGGQFSANNVNIPYYQTQQGLFEIKNQGFSGHFDLI